MNSDQVVEVLLRRSQRDHSGKTLSYFSSVWAKVVKSNDLEKIALFSTCILLSKSLKVIESHWNVVKLIKSGKKKWCLLHLTFYIRFEISCQIWRIRICSVDFREIVKCHLVILLLDDELHVARVLRLVSHGPLERPEVCVKDVEAVLAEPRNGLLLGQPAAAVLDRGEDGGGDVVVVRQGRRFAAQSAGQKFSGLFNI